MFVVVVLVDVDVDVDVRMGVVVWRVKSGVVEFYVSCCEGGRLRAIIIKEQGKQKVQWREWLLKVSIRVPGCCDGKCYSPSDTKPCSLRGRPVLQDGFSDDVAGLGNCARMC